MFGASFSNHTGIAAYKPIIQVDFDPMALGRFHPVTVPLLGHVGVTARLLAERRPAGTDRIDQASGRVGAVGDLERREGGVGWRTTVGRASARPRCSTP